MKTAIRAASALLVSAALVALLILPVAADSFTVDAYSDYTTSPGPTSTIGSYKAIIHSFSVGDIARIPISSQFYGVGDSSGRRANNWVSNSVWECWKDDTYYYIKAKSSQLNTRIYFYNSDPVTVGFYTGIESSEYFSVGEVHPLIPISPSGCPGGYSIKLTTDYLRNELYFYSGHAITNFGNLTEYLTDSFTDSVYVGNADELYFDGSFTLTPDKYGIFLTLTYHVYKFENVPLGNYTFNDVFNFNKSFDNSSYQSDQLIIPRFVVVDRTESYADQALDDIFDSFTSGQISAGQAISQIDYITGIMISRSEDPNEKIYWRIVQDSYTNRVNNYVDSSAQETMRASFESSQEDMDNLIEKLHVDKPTVELPDLDDHGIDGSYIQQLFNPIYNNGFINAMMILAVSFGIIGYILYGRRA